MSSDRIIVDTIKVGQNLLLQNLPPAHNLTDAATVMRFRELVRSQAIRSALDRSSDTGRLGSFCEIAKREGKVERHIRLLTPIAFVSPRIIAAIMDGSAPADLTVTGLAQPLAFSWTEQERRIHP